MSNGDFGDALTKHISTTVRDPAGWLLAVREVCERIDVDAAYIDLSGSLHTVCFSVWSAARNNDRLDALKEITG